MRLISYLLTGWSRDFENLVVGSQVDELSFDSKQVTIGLIDDEMDIFKVGGTWSL